MFKNTVVTTIIFILILFNFSLDILEILERILEASTAGILIFIFQAINTVLDVLITAFTETLLIAIGGFQFRRQAAYLLTSLVEFIPILDFLPLRTIGLIITAYLMLKEEEQEEIEIEAEDLEEESQEFQESQENLEEAV